MSLANMLQRLLLWISERRAPRISAFSCARCELASQCGRAGSRSSAGPGGRLYGYDWNAVPAYRLRGNCPFE